MNVVVRPYGNKPIALLAAGQPVFASLESADAATAQSIVTSAIDAVVFDMEHGPWDPSGLRLALQFMLDRRQIRDSPDLGPAVTPWVRVPQASGGETAQWLAQQALDAGVYGIVWPRVNSVEQARAVVAACRYPSPTDGPARGTRGFGPSHAARYWGLSVSDYRERAVPWPDGDLAVIVMCEDRKGVSELPVILREVRGIAAVLIGAFDLAMDMGHSTLDHPDVQAAVRSVLDACATAGVACGTAGVTAEAAADTILDGYGLVVARSADRDLVARAGREAAATQDEHVQANTHH